MVTLEQIKQGAARYVDEEFTGKLTGWQKWAVVFQELHAA